MTKSHHGTKEAKKQPAMTMKEKKAAKKSRKDSKEAVQPLIAHGN